MKYKVGKLYWKPVVLAFILDVVLTIIVGILAVIAYAILGGNVDALEQPNLVIDLISIVVGVGVTVFATMWMLKRIPENKLHNISLFVLISIIVSLPVVIFMQGYDNKVIEFISTVLWIIAPYAVWYHNHKKNK